MRTLFRTMPVAECEPSPYQIVYSRRRSLAIIVRQGKVTVRAPFGCSNRQIEQLLTAKQSWIQRHLLHQQARPHGLNWQQRSEILLAGERYNVIFSRAAKSDVYIDNDTIVILVSTRVAATNLTTWHDKLLNRWLEAQAAASFSMRLQAWAEVMGVSYSKLKLGQWQRRWGYCDSFGVIGLNWRLVMAPGWVIDYVMVHELAHRLAMDHSVYFWQIVSQNLPDYQQAISWLSYYQQELLI
ncbi:M48 family metallopeptidase [Arsukibacterium indicum]|uniref:M48 family metallopeptidase n=1 Tax=Arsukibacterium indicum TaxID=2848612 RepID=A0ABS6MQE0_9GAMM|nr:SprT family zinc-dependent metalloprotease [Arsukibacterium indicum]MBV2131009.1 M48 family metallopeptidase [Arsukibacterium indicum]